MADGTKVTRIKASSDAPKKIAKQTPAKKTKREKKPKKQSRIGKFFASPISYFKGAWSELRQVRWPNRRATWGLTLAVIAFSAFFLLIIVLLDAAFKFLFEFIIT